MKSLFPGLRRIVVYPDGGRALSAAWRVQGEERFLVVVLAVESGSSVSVCGIDKYFEAREIPIYNGSGSTSRQYRIY